jgi:hypothetical protein
LSLQRCELAAGLDRAFAGSLPGGTSFNELDGERVAADLRSHAQLWKAAALHQPDVGVTLTYLDLGGLPPTLFTFFRRDVTTTH